MPYRLCSEVVDALLLGPPNRRRQLQDFPILGDVWTALAKRPGEIYDLLITPTRERPTPEVAALIATGNAGHELNGTSNVAYLHDLVVGAFRLRQAYTVLIPTTCWWHEIEQQHEGPWPDDHTLARWIRLELRSILGRPVPPEETEEEEEQRRAFESLRTGDRAAAKLGLLLGTFRAAAEDQREAPLPDGTFQKRDIPLLKSLDEAVTQLGEAQIARLGGEALCLVTKAHAHYQRSTAGPMTSEVREERDWTGIIFQVSLNRESSAALTESVKAIKADAARQLFSISCGEIGWAVIDSGIDHTHPAFRDHAAKKQGRHRIKAAFDFRRVRAILGVRAAEVEIEALAAELADDRLRAHPAADLARLLRLIAADRDARRPVDWEKLREVVTLKLDPDTPHPLDNPHGTHVAGILGADWREGEQLTGVCPDIRLYDFRVLGSSLGDSEFAVAAALQFLRFLNRQQGLMVHGVNLSLAIRHNVRNYACGRTPVCVDAEALVRSGVVVVAAAGNRGYQEFQLTDSTTFGSYAASSITDPGNAEGVITVGSTHRQWPHTYGVSFFSSRGPTGDGRLKPDLLAPGEKIRSCIPGGRSDQMDGTSMAAPHVSGAAALLMARHRELQWDPTRVKQVLCGEATDLKRERSFQGHGMVDVLRAIQSL